jgi:hexosaminidase
MKSLLMPKALLLVSFLLLLQNLHAQPALIPQPQEVTWKEGSFPLDANTKIGIPNTKSFIHVGDTFSEELGKGLTNPPQVIFTEGSVQFIQSKDKNLGLEGYELVVDAQGIRITSETARGAFYATRTLLQMLPVDLLSDHPTQYPFLNIPHCVIRDQPHFSYRGLMLDVSRHYMPVEFVKKLIHLMALYKQNHFHWHLTDDQGWRIEIEAFPLLTTLGSQRKETMAGHYGHQKHDQTPYGPYFYTKSEVREIVQFAQERFVTIVPEIEMPGHSSAALAAYPHLGHNPDKIYQVATSWGVFEDIYMPRETTFDFLKTVLTEVMELFPSPYLHIGGDEVPKRQWKESRFAQDLIHQLDLEDEEGLQSYFIRRMDTFLTSKGRKLVGWDEIMDGGLSQNALVMSWRGTEGGLQAARQGHDVIMSPNPYCYLDHYQADPSTQPIAIGGLTTLEKIYGYHPIPSGLDASLHPHILGLQGNIWTEYMKTPAQVEYMAYPRALALAETGWSPASKKDFSNFTKRWEAHQKRLDALGVNYFGSPANPEHPYAWPRDFEK